EMNWSGWIILRPRNTRHHRCDSIRSKLQEFAARKTHGRSFRLARDYGHANERRRHPQRFSKCQPADDTNAAAQIRASARPTGSSQDRLHQPGRQMEVVRHLLALRSRPRCPLAFRLWEDKWTRYAHVGAPAAEAPAGKEMSAIYIPP